MTTPKGPATESTLGELHSKVAKVMINALDRVIETQENGETQMKDGEAVEIPVNPALLSVVTKFLAENKITCAPTESAQMSELEQKLKERQKTRRQVGNVVHLERNE